MDFAQSLSAFLGLGVAAGLNLYAAVLTVGLAQYLGWIHNLPRGLEVLSHPIVLGIAATLYLAEFVADKVPGFTPIWDGIHTFIRPLGGALLAMGAAGNMDPMVQVVALLVGGSVALGTHATKMGTRLAAHAVPDPVTHSAISVAEDFSAVGLLLLAYKYPLVALPILLVIVAAIGFALPMIFRVLRFLLRTLGGRLFSWSDLNIESEIPSWAKEPGAMTVMGFVRSGKGLARFSPVYLSQKASKFALRGKGFFGQKTLGMNPPGEYKSGLMVDTVELTTDFGQPISLYLTKDWARLYKEGRTPAKVMGFSV